MDIFSDRIAVVTGAGSGLGKAISLALAKQGCNLALVDLSEEKMADTKMQIQALGRQCSCHIADVADLETMRALPQQVISFHGAAHILVNNAGVVSLGSFIDQPIEDIEWVLDINLKGVIYACKFFLPVLLQQDEAHIVNISSMASFTGFPKQASYSASKSAVRALGQTLHAELAKSKVNISSIFPGGIATNIIDSARGSTSDKNTIKGLLAGASSAEKVATKIIQSIKKNRYETPVCYDAHILYWANRFFPKAVHRALTKSIK